ncbi:NADH-quinone oxidoreductase subunit L [Actinomadura madurae]|uniref:NADH-quinone oxidoreductase subunit L n=1 Tax=Actinomadura madurae TaxID=1993 RepID=UPI0020D1FB9A|nr:NADH-quinone oxidoreductase subunit L [Actinomadura madurae]MCP9952865.1 NADH-quinone oxidoreductase subunit L [Actinomadura madurae]MCP9969630.1 NADH-quinone oxidoreductase subunit L [Actinomadura madurae]MCP9982087.1 NADH-quinone oxidoreductase subunit L [Actinomadura madurae]MCQ0006388.1 NADH-quinone oxidoreductase subunit L [Actinomadura madurae]MCQ0018326.1 NADH-quinone oxidoreductase subunit L [Actinomadura madurae]
MKAEGVQAASWLLIALPLAGAAILLLGGRRTDKWGHLLGAAMSVASFAVGVAMFAQMIGYDAEERRRTLHLWDFIDVGTFKIGMDLLVDPLSISFVLLITGVGSLIHIYSIGYMADDPDRRRFFAYLNLFVAAMLLLVLGNNFLILFLGWEGVGLASYLLIGFWQHKPTAATAAKKAFVVNRVGDMGLIIAIALIFATFGTIDFGPVLGTGAEHPGLASQLGTGTATAIGLLLLLGACGKSAQLPLQSWLLDAMEGPTPVSALIHAATMVTAGVYLIVRSGPIFEMSDTAQLVVTIVGAATLLAGAIIGCGKDDIKKALAGSTMSQIGYMHLAAGLGKPGYVFAIAHLIAHGFFKAGLFLGAGSVMHGMKDDVNMRHYGALRSVMAITYATFGLGYLAIIGFPGLSGWFTKDGIIEAAYDKGGTSGMILGSCALVGAGITAYYMSRVMFMTFFGEKRWEDDVHPHESPAVMTWPLILLALGSVFAGGYLVLGPFAHFLEPVVGAPEHEHEFQPLAVPGIATFVLMIVGAGIAWVQYGSRKVPREAPKGSFVTVAARKDLYGDALNESLLMRPGQWLTRLAVWFDGRGVDGAVNGTAAGVGGSSGRLRRVQTGFARSYALSMLGGAALVVAALLVVNVS